MAVNRVPVLKRCRSLGMDPIYFCHDIQGQTAGTWGTGFRATGKQPTLCRAKQKRK